MLDFANSYNLALYLFVQQRGEMAQHRGYVRVVPPMRSLKRGDASAEQRLGFLGVP